MAAPRVANNRLCDLFSARWGKPLQVFQVTWDDSQFEFFEPGGELSQLFTVRLEKRILIREEYRVAYDYFEANTNFEPANGRAARYILTGHSGIGKTSFLAYALHRRLSEKKPTIVQLSTEAYVLFDERLGGGIIFDGSRSAYVGYGFAEAATGDPSYFLARSDTWALSDSTSDMQVPCTALLRSSILVIHAAPLVQDHWAQWKKEQRAKLYVMNLWGDEELGALLKTLDLDSARGLAVAQQYGPSPRTVTLLTSDPDEERYHLEQLEITTYQFTNSPSSYMKQSRRLRGGDEACSLFFVRPTASSKRGTAEICISTASLLTYITRNAPCLADILAALAQLPSTRMGACWILECYMHAWLSAPARDAIHVLANPRNLPAKLRVGPYHIVSIHSCDKALVGDLETLEQFRCFYWCPSQGRFAGIDAIVYVADCKAAWVFQAKVDEESRSTDEGLRLLIEELGKYGYDVQYKVLIFVGYCQGGTVSWGSLMDSLKDHHHGFDDILSTRIQISGNDHRALRLMQECAADAPDFTACQTDDEA